MLVNESTITLQRYSVQLLNKPKNFFRTDDFVETGLFIDNDVQYADKLKQKTKTFLFVLETKKN